METAAIVSLSGVLAAAFIPTFFKQLSYSKLSEASQQLELLHRSAAAYYAEQRREGTRLVRGCLPSSAGPTPALPSADLVLVDFGAEDVAGRETWLALGQSEPQMLRYSYEVEVPAPGCAPHSAPAYPAIIFRAWGDLDGDGNRSRLERAASLASDQRSLVSIIPLRIVDRVE